jgi:hypothetical protein
VNSIAYLPNTPYSHKAPLITLIFFSSFWHVQIAEQVMQQLSYGIDLEGLFQNAFVLLEMLLYLEVGDGLFRGRSIGLE